MAKMCDIHKEILSNNILGNNELLSCNRILCKPMDCSLPGSSVCGILQARILEWVAISSSTGSSSPRDRTRVYLHCRQILYHLSHQESPIILATKLQITQRLLPGEWLNCVIAKKKYYITTYYITRS